MVDSLIGRKIGQYEVIERVGHGGMSEVFRARSSESGQIVALKLLHSFHAKDTNLLHRFEREARAMARLNHPNVVRIHDFDVVGDTPYIAMQFIEGGSLKDRFRQLREAGKLSPLHETIRIIIEIANALAYAHDNDIVHRDIKPANIMFDKQGHAILTDFGIVKHMNATQHTATGAMIGTPAYMSPEQGLGRPGDARSDIYALGTLFFQMVTGQLPFDADKPLAVVLKHINEQVPFPSTINPDVPNEIEDIILKTMSKNPFDRYQSAHQLLEALHKAVFENSADWAQKVKAAMLQESLSPQPTTLLPPVKKTDRPNFAPSTDQRKNTTTRTPNNQNESVQRAPVIPQQDGIGVLTPPSPEITRLGKTKRRDNLPPPPLPIPSSRTPRYLIRWLTIVLAVMVLTLITVLSVPNLWGDSTNKLGTSAPQNQNSGGVFQATRTPLPTSTPMKTESPTEEAAATPSPAPTNTEPLVPTEQPTREPVLTPTPIVLVPQQVTEEPVCSYQLQLLGTFTYNLAANAAPTGERFPFNWNFYNVGSCPIPAGSYLAYKSGETFGQTDPVFFSESLPIAQELTLSTRLLAPTRSGRYDSTWGIYSADGTIIGEIPFYIVIYSEVTSTPIPTKYPTVTKVWATKTATRVPPTATRVSPTATRVSPTATRVSPTATRVSPIATRVPPTATRVPPTATRVPPTATRVPPTATRVPPTATLLPPTATPLPPTETPPPPTATVVLEPTLSPTPAPGLDFNVFVKECDYVGIDWRCRLEINVYGGSGGPYNIFVYDATPPTEYQGVTVANHSMIARRCNPWVHEIRVEDPNSGQNVSKNFYFDPNGWPIAGLLGGACTPPP